jgi:sugar lactone lactonase YvrE
MLKTNLALLVTVLTATAVCSNADTLVATFEYAEPDFEFSDEEGGGDTFDFIELPGELHFMNPGEPAGPKILQVTTSGSVIDSFQYDGEEGGGLAWDGTYVYVLDYDKREIYKYTSAGSLLPNWPKNAPDNASSDRIPYGIAADAQHLWVTSYGKYDRIIQMTKGASLTGSVINAPNTPHPHPTAVTTDGNYLMYVDDATDTLYEITK